MKYRFSNDKFNTVIEELGEEYKDLLIEVVISKSSDRDLDSISISELTKIDIEVKEKLKNKAQNDRINRISLIFSMLGAVYALIGMMVMMITVTNRTYMDEATLSISIVLVFLGFLVMIMGSIMHFLLKTKRKTKKESNIDYEIQIINKWRLIESLIYQIMPRSDTMSLRSMMRNLQQAKVITEDDANILEDIMFYRNKIVHNSPQGLIITDEVKSLLEKADKLIEKLTNLV